MIGIPDGQALYEQGRQQKAVHDQFQLERAWDGLQSVPSYVERHQREALREFRGDPCLGCNKVICTCDGEVQA